MIKKILFCTMIFSSMAPLLACCNKCSIPCDDLQLVFKQGYFLPQDKTLRCMFKNSGHKSGGYFFEGAVRYRLIKGLFGELNGSWFRHCGSTLVCTVKKSASCATPTTTNTATCGDKFLFKLPTFGFGLKYFCNFCEDSLSLFAGAGLKAFFMKTKACLPEPSCCGCDSKNSVGGNVGIGLQYKPLCGLFLEAFIDYNIKTLKTSTVPCCSYNNCLKIGGLAVGLGLGYKF